eukprot:CAMPEP_0170451316 /NCGR_PEP_ID=MMETSP0123-20130129/604_1 /TAXON_ID=182087 /ORGANISM="Favella ehrenbergii, Strain Fehren 1" /LENGTH=65 /DNA_ID=CAMNT_0010712979 /DNA_START=237 /DNA_END=434 /DNA_ORIENTATION=-
MSAGVSTHFAMKKQMSHVRQDDAVQLRPNTAFNPMGKQNTELGAIISTSINTLTQQRVDRKKCRA